MRLEQISNSISHSNTHSTNFTSNTNNPSKPKRNKKPKSSKLSINHTSYFTTTSPEEPPSIHEDRYKFLINMGSNINICSKLLLFRDFHPCSNHTIMVGGNNILHAQGISTVKALNTINGKDIHVQLNNTLFIPSFSMNIISISHFIKDFGQSHSFSGHRGQFVVYHHSHGKATPILRSGKHGPSNYITILQCPHGQNTITHATVTTTNKLLKDHVWLNHCGMSMLCKVYKHSSQSIPHSATLPQCIICVHKKMKHPDMHHRPAPHTTQPMEELHINLISPFEVSHNGSSYTMPIINSYS